MNIRLIKWLDEYVGRLLAFLVGRFAPGTDGVGHDEPRVIAVMKFWGMGSVALSTPLLVWLRRTHPRAKLLYVTLKSNEELCRLVPHIDDVVTVSIKNPFKFVRTFLRTALILRRHRVDVLFDLEFFAYASGVLAFLSSASRRIGFTQSNAKGPDRSVFYTETRSFDGERHVVSNFLTLADRSAEIQFPDLRPFLGRSANLLPRRPFVMNINASRLAIERRWPRESFLILARRMLAQFGSDIILIGSEDEAEYTGRLRKLLGNCSRVVDVSGKTSIRDLLGLLARARMLITNDSGPLHLATVLDVPTIALFGPETPVRYGSLATTHRNLYRDLWCSPCMTIENLKTVHCINRRKCMTELSIDNVWEAVKDLAETTDFGEARRFSTAEGFGR